MAPDGAEPDVSLAALLDDYAALCRLSLETEAERVPDQNDFMASRSLTGIAVPFTVRRVRYDSEEAVRAAQAAAKAKDCRLVCRSMQGGTDCFWVCPK